MGLPGCMCFWEGGCGGAGTEHCAGCGGDLCICVCGGERPCSGCEDCDHDDDHGASDDDGNDGPGSCVFGPECVCPHPDHGANECATAEMMEAWAAEASTAGETPAKEG